VLAREPNRRAARMGAPLLASSIVRIFRNNSVVTVAKLSTLLPNSIAIRILMSDRAIGRICDYT
jgi:hypothetical protein